MMLEERVALEIINAHGRLLDLPEISSLAEIRYDSERQLNLRIARAIISIVLEEAAKQVEALPAAEIYCGVKSVWLRDVTAAIRAILQAKEQSDER